MTLKVVAFEPKFYTCFVCPSPVYVANPSYNPPPPVRICILISAVKERGILCVTVINHGVKMRVLRMYQGPCRL